MENKVRVGVIGCGAIGRDHIRRLHDLVPGCQVVACADYFEEAARKTAAGAASEIPLFSVTNLARVLDDLNEREIRIIGMDGAAEHSIFETDLTGPLALVMGSEESGMRRLTREKCTDITKIPMASGVESLNVSVAAGIALYEAVRQRGLN